MPMGISAIPNFVIGVQAVFVVEIHSTFDKVGEIFYIYI